jgi:hypothetical protein
MIETAFEVMHAGLEKTFAVQAAPETNRAELQLRWQRVARKIDFHFIRVQVDIVKNNDAFNRLFDDLRAPARFLARVVAFATMSSSKVEESMTHDRPSPQNAFVGWGFGRRNGELIDRH